ncbi:MAG: hypothetical protein LBF54_01895 [Holosporaceae bacterium]|jgi:hypothetical protein|nr:hypothetical protein [Holosporaceae bacterium]
MKMIKKTFSREEKFRIIDIGKNEANILIVDWVKHGSMVLCSQLFSPEYKNNNREDGTKCRLEEVFGTMNGLKFVRGIDWVKMIAQRQGLLTNDQLNGVIESIIGLADIFEDKVRVDVKSYIGVIDSLERYISMVESKTGLCRGMVLRDAYLAGSQEGHDALMSCLVELKNNLHKIFGGEKLGHVAYSCFRTIFGIRGALEPKLNIPSAGEWEKAASYVSHLMHTEAQLIVAAILLEDSVDIREDSVYSSKLPCVSCQYLPLGPAGWFYAFDLGIMREDWESYNRAIFAQIGDNVLQVWPGNSIGRRIVLKYRSSKEAEWMGNLICWGLTHKFRTELQELKQYAVVLPGDTSKKLNDMITAADGLEAQARGIDKTKDDWKKDSNKLRNLLKKWLRSANELRVATDKIVELLDTIDSAAIALYEPLSGEYLKLIRFMNPEVRKKFDACFNQTFGANMGDLLSLIGSWEIKFRGIVTKFLQKHDHVTQLYNE